jgi:hypothetical protein
VSKNAFDRWAGRETRAPVWRNPLIDRHIGEIPLPSGKRLQKTMERSTIFNGKTHYFNGHFQ